MRAGRVPPRTTRTAQGDTDMLKITGEGTAQTCDGLTRRDFLQVGTLGAVGLSMADVAAAASSGRVAPGHENRNCIMIFNLGAPSQLDTWDMKPDAPAEIRGPFQPISTTSPEIQISQIFPQMAKHGDKFSLVRSCYHTAAAGARHRPPDAPDRPTVPRWHQHAARWLRGEFTCSVVAPICRRT